MTHMVYNDSEIYHMVYKRQLLGLGMSIHKFDTRIHMLYNEDAQTARGLQGSNVLC